MRLEADHSGVCCYDQSVEDDVDNYEVVCANIQEMYDASIKRAGESSTHHTCGAIVVAKDHILTLFD